MTTCSHHAARAALRFVSAFLAVALFLVVSAYCSQAQSDNDIDWNRARALRQRVLRGEKLSPEDQAYYEQAVRAFNARNGRGPRTPGGRESIGLTPLTDLGKGEYKQESGGLYGKGNNKPQSDLLAAAMKASAQVRPLDAQGRSAADGKIVLLSIGMSNTTQEFSTFKRIADPDPQKSPTLVIVDGAQGGQDAEAWIRPGSQDWGVVEERLKAAGVTPQQVQAVWIKQALAGPSRYGDFPAHARRLADDLVKIVRMAKERFPNLRLAYLSNRIYAGYASTPLNPEPYAYESAFAVRWAIQAQGKDAAKEPVVLWGPYLWADGVKGRKTDSLVWKRDDLGPDGTHPSASGRQKVAEQLLRFFKTDPTARRWFLKERAAAFGE